MLTVTPPVAWLSPLATLYPKKMRYAPLGFGAGLERLSIQASQERGVGIGPLEKFNRGRLDDLVTVVFSDDEIEDHNYKIVEGIIA